MAATKTLAEMRAAVRLLADVEAEDDELDELVNAHCRALYDRLVTARGHEYYAKSHTIDLVSGTATYDLPADFYELSAAMATDGSDYKDLHPWQPQQLAALLRSESSGNASLSSYRYRLQGKQIEIRPKPSVSNHSLELRYVPAMPALELDVDTFDGVNGWERWVELAVAIDLLDREESETGPLQLKLAREDARIDKLAGNRDAGHPETIVDVRHDWAGSRTSEPLEPP